MKRVVLFSLLALGAFAVIAYIQAPSRPARTVTVTPSSYSSTAPDKSLPLPGEESSTPTNNTLNDETKSSIKKSPAISLTPVENELFWIGNFISLTASQQHDLERRLSVLHSYGDEVKSEDIKRVITQVLGKYLTEKYLQKKAQHIQGVVTRKSLAQVYNELDSIELTTEQLDKARNTITQGLHDMLSTEELKNFLQQELQAILPTEKIATIFDRASTERSTLEKPAINIQLDSPEMQHQQLTTLKLHLGLNDTQQSAMSEAFRASKQQLQDYLEQQAYATTENTSARRKILARGAARSEKEFDGRLRQILSDTQMTNYLEFKESNSLRLDNIQ